MSLCGLVLQQIDYLTAQYTTAKNKVLSDLDSKQKNRSFISNFFFFFSLSLTGLLRNKYLCCLTDIGPLLGARIHSNLEKEVVPALDTALLMAGGKNIVHFVDF